MAYSQGEQARNWFEDELREGLLSRLTRDPLMVAQKELLGQAVMRGDLNPAVAAQDLWTRLGRMSRRGREVWGQWLDARRDSAYARRT